MEQLTITRHLDLEKAVKAIGTGAKIQLSDEAKEKVSRCKRYLEKRISESDSPIYGINTGFGSLCNVRIPHEDLNRLQTNLVMSHACGMGETVPESIVRLMMLLKVHGLSLGHSGVQLKTIETLVAMLNKNITPVVYELGSLGASGDLAPLAHLSLPLIGRGQVWHNGTFRESKRAFADSGISHVSLEAKEGLALLNGTQFMSSYATFIVCRASELMDMTLRIAALSLESFNGHTAPFDSDLHALRPHPGQARIADSMLKMLEGSKLNERKKEHVQDPYSFRCIPQVLGACVDTITHAYGVVQREVDSVTDNPTIFPEQDKIISGGNFHGEPLALVLDQLAVAMTEIASISERRIYKLISGQRGLPSFLVEEAGLNSGFMIAQYTAASIVSQCKQLSMPASVDTIDSSQGQEDHVSMGANSATKAFRILENMERVLAIELMTACQALEFVGVENTSPTLKTLHSTFRSKVPFMREDAVMSDFMRLSLEFIRSPH